MSADPAQEPYGKAVLPRQSPDDPDGETIEPGAVCQFPVISDPRGIQRNPSTVPFAGRYSHPTQPS